MPAPKMITIQCNDVEDDVLVLCRSAMSPGEILVDMDGVTSGEGIVTCIYIDEAKARALAAWLLATADDLALTSNDN